MVAVLMRILSHINQKVMNVTDLLESNGSTVAHVEDTHFLITDINNE